MMVDLFGNSRVPNPPPGTPVGSVASYAAGDKSYGAGRPMPNIGPVSGQGMLGYSQRDNQAQARKNAILRRLQGQGTGNPMNQQVLNYQMGT
jgi:hypothetical protein